MVENNEFKSGGRMDEILVLPGITQYYSALTKIKKMINNFQFDEALVELKSITI